MLLITCSPEQLTVFRRVTPVSGPHRTSHSLRDRTLRVLFDLHQRIIQPAHWMDASLSGPLFLWGTHHHLETQVIWSAHCTNRTTLLILFHFFLQTQSTGDTFCSYFHLLQPQSEAQKCDRDNNPVSALCNEPYGQWEQTAVWPSQTGFSFLPFGQSLQLFPVLIRQFNQARHLVSSNTCRKEHRDAENWLRQT